MGLLAGFGSPRVVLKRIGTAVDHDPNAAEPSKFKHLVNSPDYTETWVEEFDVFHNPNVLYPLEKWMLPGASHHWLLPDKQMRSHTPDWQPLGSMAQIMINDGATAEAGYSRRCSARLGFDCPAGHIEMVIHDFLQSSPEDFLRLQQCEQVESRFPPVGPE